MKNTEKEKVPFDPGFSELVGNFPHDIYKYLDEIAVLKQNHQKKFAFTNFENQLIPIIKLCASFYLGCVLWGSFLANKYKTDFREISGNPILELSEEEKEKLNYNDEIDFITEFLEKFEKSAKYYLNRKSKINDECLKYFEVYKNFVKINDNFKNLKFTNEIKLPPETTHFENYSEDKLDNLEKNIKEIIKSGNLEKLLEVGFYK